MAQSHISTIVFDLGAVILQWRPYELLKQVFPEGGIGLYPLIMGNPDWLRFDAGSLTENEMTPHLMERLHKNKEEIEQFWHFVHDHLHPQMETLDLLKEVQDKGFETYVLSNMSHDLMHHFLQRDSFWESFDGIMYSAEEGLLKPHPETFHRLYERFGIDPSSAIFLDDMPANIEGAQQTGMDGIVFTDAKACRIELITRGILS